MAPFTGTRPSALLAVTSLPAVTFLLAVTFLPAVLRNARSFSKMTRQDGAVGANRCV